MSRNISIRAARVDDLPAIQGLIKLSFEAMLRHTYLSASFWRNGATRLIQDELVPGKFESIYQNKSDNHFWVAEHETKNEDGTSCWKVIGCVGIKREPPTCEDIELVRMAVDETSRGQGIGKLLIKEVLGHCRQIPGAKKIVLTTGNPDSVKFYQKCGFTSYWRLLFYRADIAL